MEFGRYQLLDRISVGGMAEVFRAMTRAEGSEKHVAIKRMLPHLCRDERFVEMFIEEARLTAQLMHGNIAPVFDFGVVEDSYYLAMELVDGPNLRTIQNELSERGQLMPVEIVLYVAQHLCEALDYAHGLRDASGRHLSIVHRDISPHNVLISFDGEVKLVDFGIAKVRMRAAETTHGRIKGKSAYMAPEQVRSQGVDGRADIFGAGAVLHELLCGKPVFADSTHVGTLRKVLHGRIPRPSRINPRVPPELDVVILRALARKVEERWQRADDMRAELQRFAEQSGNVLMQQDVARWMRESFAHAIPSGAVDVPTATEQTPYDPGIGGAVVEDFADFEEQRAYDDEAPTRRALPGDLPIWPAPVEPPALAARSSDRVTKEEPIVRVTSPRAIYDSVETQTSPDPQLQDDGRLVSWPPIEPAHERAQPTGPQGRPLSTGPLPEQFDTLQEQVPAAAAEFVDEPEPETHPAFEEDARTELYHGAEAARLIRGAADLARARSEGGSSVSHVPAMDDPSNQWTAEHSLVGPEGRRWRLLGILLILAMLAVAGIGSYLLYRARLADAPPPAPSPTLLR